MRATSTSCSTSSVGKASCRCWSRAARPSPAAFHRAGLVDRYVLYLAPALFGGDDGRAAVRRSGRADHRRRVARPPDLGRSRSATTCASTRAGASLMFTGIVEELGHVDRARRRPRLRIGAAHRARRRAASATRSPVNGCCLTVVALGRRTGGRPTSPTRPRPHATSAICGPATRSTSSGRCGSRTASAATSCRATSTGSARSSTPAPDLRVARAGATCCATSSRRARSPSTASASRSSTARRRLHRRRHPPHRRGHDPRAQGHRATRVNLEVDVIAKYVERLLDAHTATQTAGRGGADRGETVRTES